MDLIYAISDSQQFSTIENVLEKKEYEKQEGDVEEMTDKQCFDIHNCGCKNRLISCQGLYTAA